MMSIELVILCGLQGAGKSTFYHTRFASTHRHVSKDNFRNASNRERRQQQLIRQALQEGHSVVVDNTNVTVAERATLIALAREFDARVVGYYFASQIELCLERNSRREGKSRVPDVALYVTAQRLQIPTYAEGFDQLYYVRVKEDCGFTVEHWREEPGGASEGPAMDG
jgi:predicted kinase